MKTKFRILWKTLKYIDEDTWTILGISVVVIVSILLGILTPIFDFDTTTTFFSIGLVFWNILSWVAVIGLSIAIICFLVYIGYKLYEGICDVVDDIYYSYLNAKEKVEAETKE